MARYYKDIRCDIEDRINELVCQIKEAERARIEHDLRNTNNVYYKYDELYMLQDALKALQD